MRELQGLIATTHYSARIKTVTVEVHTTSQLFEKSLAVKLVILTVVSAIAIGYPYTAGWGGIFVQRCAAFVCISWAENS